MRKNRRVKSVKSTWFKRFLFAGIIIVAMLMVIFAAPRILIFFGNYNFSKNGCTAQNHVSLTVGKSMSLKCDYEQVSWISDNPLIIVESRGTIRVDEDLMYPHGQAIISALDNITGKSVCQYHVTVVPWQVDNEAFQIVNVLPAYRFMGLTLYPPLRLSKGQKISDFIQKLLPPYRILGQEDGYVYFSAGKKLFKTNDGMTTREYIGKLPFTPGKNKMLVTPFGYFLRVKRQVYRSHNLMDWHVTFETQFEPWLLDNMDFGFDAQTQTGYVYVKEYSTGNPQKYHHVYRGIFPESGEEEWSQIHTLQPLDDQKQHRAIFLESARHYHLVKVDPFTGHVWIGTGDQDHDSMIFYSTDHGDSFVLLGTGNQGFRTLGFWFTEHYIFWNTDSGVPPQRIFRISRKNLEQKGSTTPVIASGRTKTGITYYVVESAEPNAFPVAPGFSFVEETERDIQGKGKLLVVDDPEYNFREIAADLTNGSHFSFFPIKSDTNEEILLLSSTSEGFSQYNTRDTRGRLFTIREADNGELSVNEVYTTCPYQSNYPRVRIEAAAYDRSGYIYFYTYGTTYGDAIMIGKLHGIH